MNVPRGVNAPGTKSGHSGSDLTAELPQNSIFSEVELSSENKSADMTKKDNGCQNKVESPKIRLSHGVFMWFNLDLTKDLVMAKEVDNLVKVVPAIAVIAKEGTSNSSLYSSSRKESAEQDLSVYILIPDPDKSKKQIDR